MSANLTVEQVRRLRARHQLLASQRRGASASETVAALFALQAQEWPSAQLAIHTRCPAVSQADVVKAREDERAFVLTWALRGTLHLVPAEDLRWLLELCAPAAIRGSSSRYRQLGLTEDARERGLEAIEAVLSREGALIRPQLAQALESYGIPVAGQAIHHLVRYAALRGLVCFGPDVDGDLSYVLLDDWLPAAIETVQPADPLSELARRYLAAYAPATAADFARWSGISKAQVRRAWQAVADDCVTVGIPDGQALMLKEQAIALASLQRGRSSACCRAMTATCWVTPAAPSWWRMLMPSRCIRGGGLIRACVLINGEPRASWKLEKRRAGLRVNVGAL